MIGCRASHLFVGSAVYFLLHCISYLRFSRKWSALASERRVFLYQLASAVPFSLAVLSVAAICADPSAISAALGVIFLHGLYSLSFLELWSLAQGSYSISILIRVMQRGALTKARLQEELTHIGQRKKHDRLSALSRLRLLRREGEQLALTVPGHLVSAALQCLVWLSNVKERG